MNANIQINRQKSTAAAEFYRRKPPPQTTAVDSLKIRIPTKLIKLKNYKLHKDERAHRIYPSTGEMDGEARDQRKVWVQFTDSGDKIEYKGEMMNVSNKGPEDFLTIKLTSKINHSGYFDGINSKTIHSIYDKLMKHGVFYARPDAFFEQTVCTDVDIKRDAVMPAEQFRQQIKQLTRDALGDSKHFRQRWLKRDNIGLQFSERDSTSFKKRPFLKFYHKGVELLHSPKKKAFANHYLGEYSYQDLAREETTIKNLKHFRYLYGEGFAPTLGNVVSLSKGQMNAAFAHARSCYFDVDDIAAKRERENVAAEDILKGMDRVIFALMQDKVAQGGTIDDILNLVLAMFPGSDAKSRVQRTRYKKKIADIYELIVKDERGEYCPILDLFLGDSLAA